MCFPIVRCAAQYRRFGSRPVRRMRMEGGKELSMTQLMALVWLADLAPAAQLLRTSAEVGGAGGWLSPLLALLVLAALGGLMGWAAGREGLAEKLRRGLGPVLGRGVLFLYIGWAALLAGRRLGQCALRLSEGGSRDGSAWFFLGVMALTALWMGGWCCCWRCSGWTGRDWFRRRAGPGGPYRWPCPLRRHWPPDCMAPSS